MLSFSDDNRKAANDASPALDSPCVEAHNCDQLANIKKNDLRTCIHENESPVPFFLLCKNSRHCTCSPCRCTENMSK